MVCQWGAEEAMAERDPVENCIVQYDNELAVTFGTCSR